MSPSGDLPNPGIEHISLMSPAFSGGFFTTRATWEALKYSLSGTYNKKKKYIYIYVYVSSGLMTRLHLQEL